MRRNYLKGRDGDRINAILAAAGYNYQPAPALVRPAFARPTSDPLSLPLCVPLRLKENILHGRRCRQLIGGRCGTVLRSPFKLNAVVNGFTEEIADSQVARSHWAGAHRCRSRGR